MHYIYPVYRCIEHLLHVQLHIHIRYQTFYSQTLHLSAVYMSVLRSGFEFCVSITDCSCAKFLRVFLQNSAEIYPLRVLSSDHALIWAPKTYNRDDSGYISIQYMNWLLTLLHNYMTTNSVYLIIYQGNDLFFQ